MAQDLATLLAVCEKASRTQFHVTIDPNAILPVVRDAKATIEQQAASIAAKDKEIDRLRAVDPRTSLLTVIADIREKTGVGGKPMLDELADAIAEKLTSKESALAKAVTIIKLGLDVVSEERGWGTYQRMEGSELYADANAFRNPAEAFIAEHGPEST
jgi:hypothetical protein